MSSTVANVTQVSIFLELKWPVSGLWYNLVNLQVVVLSDVPSV